jgi:hypothetical protein
MNNSDEKHLPFELDAIGERLTASRPVASEETLDRAVTRASQIRPRKASSLLWMSDAPSVAKPTKLGLGAVAGALAMTGAGGLGAVASAHSFSMPDTTARVCPHDAIVKLKIGNLDVCVGFIYVHVNV